MAKGKAIMGLLKGSAKAVGGALKTVGGLVMDGIKSLTKGGSKKPQQITSGDSAKNSNEVKTEVSKLTNNKPEPDKLAEQDNRAAEAEVQASKITESKSRNDKNQVQSISSRTRSILQNYGLKGELVRSVKKSVKDEGIQSESSKVVSRSDIFNIYQQKAPNVNIDRVVEMLAANNEILANVNETIRLIHNQGTIETEFKKIKGEKAKVLSEKAKDEAESVNKATDKSSQKLAEYKAQALAIRDALHDDLSKSGSNDQMDKMLELMAQQQIAQAKDQEESSGLMDLVSGGLLSALPMLLNFMPTNLLSKGAGFLGKAFNKFTSAVGSTWDGVKSFLGFGGKDAAKGAEVLAKDVATSGATTKVAKAGVKDFFKKLSPKALKVVTKKFITKAMLKAAAKGAGKAALKKVPVVGALAGLGFGIERCLGDKPDYAGAALDITSGIASIFPGIGTGISAALDVAGIVRDVNNCIDDMKEGKIDPEMFDDEDLAELLVEPTKEELELDAAQESNASKQSWIDTGLGMIPLIGPLISAGRSGYRYMRENGVISGNQTLDKMSGYKTDDELKAEISSKSPVQSSANIGVKPTETSHKEAKSSSKVFKGVSVVDNKTSDTDEVELSDAGPDFTLSGEQRELMEYWKTHQANPTDPESAQRLVDYWKSYEGKLDYSQEVRDVNKGSTDCSGMVMNSMQNLFGIDVTDGGKGYCAAAFATNNVGAVVTQSDINSNGDGSGKITKEMMEQLQPGDVIYTRLDKWKGKRPYAVGHASLYIGDGMCLSQGGAKKGPYRTPLSYYDGKFVLAKRYLGTGNAEISKAELESSSPVGMSTSSISTNSAANSITKIAHAIANTAISSTNKSVNKPVTTNDVSSSQSGKPPANSTNSNPVNVSDDHRVTDNSKVINNYNNYTYNINNSTSDTPNLKSVS